MGPRQTGSHIPFILFIDVKHNPRRTAIGTVAHHRQRSHYFLNRAHVNLAFGDTANAADGLRRSASHAATAAAVHWHYPHRSQRLLANALRCVIFDLRLPTRHLNTFDDVYAVRPPWSHTVDHPTALRDLTLLRRRVSGLVADLNDAIAAEPEPPTLQQVINSAETNLPLPSWERVGVRG